MSEEELERRELTEAKDLYKEEDLPNLIGDEYDKIFVDGILSDNPNSKTLLVEEKKRLKIEAIRDYDHSTAINSFEVDEMSLWLTKEERAALNRRFILSQLDKKQQDNIWINNQRITLYVTKALAMLEAIERYATACYDITKAHIAQVTTLTEIETIDKYDFKSGYPEKLTFKTL